MKTEKRHPRLLEDGIVLVKLVENVEYAFTFEDCRKKLLHLQEAINLLSGEKSPQAITLRPESMSYLIHGELNLSCKAIITHAMGLPLNSMLIRQYPRDIESIRFCRLLLENCPEIAANFNSMTEVSPKWAAVVQEEAWATLCDAMDTECPNWRNTLWKNGCWQGQSALAVLKKTLNQ